jgi:hypothetical protein
MRVKTNIEGRGEVVAKATGLGHWQLDIFEICGSYICSYFLELIGEIFDQAF